MMTMTDDSAPPVVWTGHYGSVDGGGLEAVYATRDEAFGWLGRKYAARVRHGERMNAHVAEENAKRIARKGADAHQDDTDWLPEQMSLKPDGRASFSVHMDHWWIRPWPVGTSTEEPADAL